MVNGINVFDSYIWRVIFRFGGVRSIHKGPCPAIIVYNIRRFTVQMIETLVYCVHLVVLRKQQIPAIKIVKPT